MFGEVGVELEQNMLENELKQERLVFRNADYWN